MDNQALAPSTFVNTSLSDPHPPLAAVNAREWIALIASVSLWDQTVYSGGGFAGWALLLAVLPILLIWGSAVRRGGRTGALIMGMLLLLSVRLAWQGHPVAVLIGFALVMALVMSLNGFVPHVLEGSAFCIESQVRGGAELLAFVKYPRLGLKRIERPVLVPAVVGAVFVVVFLLANPDMARYLNGKLNLILTRLPSVGRIWFWFVMAWMTAGMLRAHVTGGFEQSISSAFPPLLTERSEPGPLAYFTARNTLLTVALLFAAYLTYEVIYLVVRKIPAGFYYAGYAHEGAFWLTVALAFSTFTLGFVMRDGLLARPGAALLRRLAWLWTAENLILAGCVVHRLQIYVNFNGMSQMRVVAYFGVVAVVVGFLLAVVKVMRERSLLWLIRLDLWALFLIVFAWTLTPVDWIVTRCNVSEILSGNLSPSVQLGWHPIGAEGIPALLPLAEIGDSRIREGVRALLADSQSRFSVGKDWSQLQLAEVRALRLLNENRLLWVEYADAGKRAKALKEFQTFTWQWY